MKTPRQIPTDNSLFLVTHVRIKSEAGRMLIDSQTAAGIRQWASHFSRVTFLGIGVTLGDEELHSTDWVDLNEGPVGRRCKLIPLPNGYRLGAMLKNYSTVRSLIAREIPLHEHLCFTLGGLVGDWPAIAAIESIRQGRRYAAWFDRVEPIIIRRTLSTAPLRRQIKETITLPLMERYHRFCCAIAASPCCRGQTLLRIMDSGQTMRTAFTTHIQEQKTLSRTLVSQKNGNESSPVAHCESSTQVGQRI